MLRERICEVCSKDFQVVLPPSRQKTGRGRFCSVMCKVAWTKGQHLSRSTEFKRGMKVFFSKEHRRKISEARKGHKDTVGTDNGMWRGRKVGYHALHSWVRRQLGKPSKCVLCGNVDKVQWANKSHKYKRDISDWIQLCYWCHRKYDQKNGWGKATKKFPEIS